MLSPDVVRAVEKIAIYIVPAMLGIILHEVAHGYAAARLGDPTARLMGRLSINPLPHIDPAGLIVFVLTSLSGSFVFGWAKPVPVDPRYFAHPRKGMMIVALAGPLTNFLLALFFTALLYLSLEIVPATFWNAHPQSLLVLKAMSAGVFINLGLGWLNLLPIPPLDGSKIAAYFLPENLAFSYLRIQRYGFLVLIVLLISGVLDSILTPLIHGSSQMLLSFLR